MCESCIFGTIFENRTEGPDIDAVVSWDVVLAESIRAKFEKFGDFLPFVVGEGDEGMVFGAFRE